MINLDFSNVPQQVLLEEGLYKVRIKKAELKKSSTGKDMLSVIFEEDTTKSAIFENYTLTPDALWKVRELLDAAGFDTKNMVEFDPSTLVGLEFNAKVVQRTLPNDGATVNGIKKLVRE